MKLSTEEKDVAIKKIDEKLNIFLEQKQIMLDLFTHLDEFSKIYEKIKNQEIITKTEHILACKISNNFEMSKNIYADLNVIRDYQLVIDADEIVDQEIYKNTLTKDNIFVIKKGDRVGLIQKINNGNDIIELKAVFDAHTYTLLHVNENDYNKYKLIQLQENIYHKDRGIFQVKIKNNEKTYDLYKIYYIYSLLFMSPINFDNDNISIVWDSKGYQNLIFRKQLDNGDLIIKDIGPKFKYNGMGLACFDNYGTIEATLTTGENIILKKNYNNGEFIGIDVFKKSSLFSKEKKLEELCRKESDFLVITTIYDI